MKITGIEIKQYAKPLDMYTQMRELQESDPAI